MRRILGRKFFSRDTETVARELLGKYLCRRVGNETQRYKIIEVEVYDGIHDKASHASRGKTTRNAPMWGHPGYWYVYFTYGIHWMLNVVTREYGYPGAILIRGIGGIIGPARLTKALHIDKELNGKLATKTIGLWIEDRGEKIPLLSIAKTPRIGIDSSGPYWSKRKLRFVLEK